MNPNVILEGLLTCFISSPARWQWQEKNLRCQKLNYSRPQCIKKRQERSISWQLQIKKENKQNCLHSWMYVKIDYFHDSLKRITRLQRPPATSISYYCMNFPDCCPYKQSKGANTSFWNWHCFTFFHPLSLQPMEILSKQMTSFFFQLFI